jgi:hypothetical protein
MRKKVGQHTCARWNFFGHKPAVRSIHSQLILTIFRPLEMGKRLASFFLFKIRERFGGFWLESSPAFLSQPSTAKPKAKKKKN